MCKSPLEFSWRNSDLSKNEPEKSLLVEEMSDVRLQVLN
jgi:hypothetical protein